MRPGTRGGTKAEALLAQRQLRQGGISRLSGLVGGPTRNATDRSLRLRLVYRLGTGAAR